VELILLLSPALSNAVRHHLTQVHVLGAYGNLDTGRVGKERGKKEKERKVKGREGMERQMTGKREGKQEGGREGGREEGREGRSVPSTLSLRLGRPGAARGQAPAGCRQIHRTCN